MGQAWLGRCMGGKNGRRWARRTVMVPAAGLLAGTTAMAVAGTAAAAPAGRLAARGATAPGITNLDWPAYLYSVKHRSVTAGPTTITPANAGALAPAWVFTEQPPTRTDQPAGGFSASPTVADGMVFIGSQTGDFYALNETTGQVVWKRTLDYEKVGHNGNCKNVRGIVGTATVAPAPRTGALTVYVAGARHLYALDAATGKRVWRSLVGPRHSAKVQGAYFNYASPTVANGHVYMGVSSSCDAPFVRGGVQSFSQRTGRRLHSFWTDPRGQVGASVWSSEAASKKWVWATTGDPKFTGKHLYHAYSVVRLRSTKLSLHGSWQLKLGQAADLDFGSSPTLFTARIHRRTTGLVGACSKDGRYYALRRDSLGAGPVWSVRVGARAHTGKGMCLASAVWARATNELYVAGDGTRINGTYHAGSVREVSPRNGRVRWARGLGCNVLGTPSLDAATGVIAAGTYYPCASGQRPATYLLDAKTGAILATFSSPDAYFSQPVFVGPYLITAGESGKVTAYTPAPAGKPACTGWCGTPPLKAGPPPVP